MVYRMTARAQAVINTATAHANRLEHGKITATHVLLSVLDLPDGIACDVAERFFRGIPTIKSLLADERQDRRDSIAKVVKAAAEQARLFSSKVIRPEHLLLAALKTEPQRQHARQLLEEIVGPAIPGDASATASPGLHRAAFLGLFRNDPIFITGAGGSFNA